MKVDQVHLHIVEDFGKISDAEAIEKFKERVAAEAWTVLMVRGGRRVGWVLLRQLDVPEPDSKVGMFSLDEMLASVDGFPRSVHPSEKEDAIAQVQDFLRHSFESMRPLVVAAVGRASLSAGVLYQVVRGELPTVERLTFDVDGETNVARVRSRAPYDTGGEIVNLLEPLPADHPLRREMHVESVDLDTTTLGDIARRLSSKI